MGRQQSELSTLLIGQIGKLGFSFSVSRTRVSCLAMERVIRNKRICSVDGKTVHDCPSNVEYRRLRSGAQWQQIRTLIAECSDLLAAASKLPIAQGVAHVHGSRLIRAQAFRYEL